MKFEYQNLNILTTELLHIHGDRTKEQFEKIIIGLREAITNINACSSEKTTCINQQAFLDLTFNIFANIGVYYELKVPKNSTANKFNQILYLIKTSENIQIYLELQERPEEIKLNIFVSNKIFSIKLKKDEKIFLDNLCMKGDSIFYKLFLSIEKTDSGFLSKPKYFLNFYFNGELICYQEVEFNMNSFSSYTLVDFVFNRNEHSETEVFWAGQNMSELNKQKVLQNLINYNNFQIKNDNIFLTDKLFYKIFGDKNKVIPQSKEQKELLYKQYILEDKVIPSKNENKTKKKHSLDIDVRRVENALGIKVSAFLTKLGRLVHRDRGRLVVGNPMYLKMEIKTKSFNNFCYAGIFRLFEFGNFELIHDWILTYFLFEKEIQKNYTLLPLTLFIKNVYGKHRGKLTPENYKQITATITDNLTTLFNKDTNESFDAKLDLLHTLYDAIFTEEAIGDIQVLGNIILHFNGFYRNARLSNFNGTKLLKFNFEKCVSITDSVTENTKITSITLHISTHINLILELIQDFKIGVENTEMSVGIVFAYAHKLLLKAFKMRNLNMNVSNLLVEKVTCLLDSVYPLYFDDKNVFTRNWLYCNIIEPDKQTCLLIALPFSLVIKLWENNAIEPGIKLLNKMLSIILASDYNIEFPPKDIQRILNEFELHIILNTEQIFTSFKDKQTFLEYIIDCVKRYKIFFRILAELLTVYSINFRNEDIYLKTETRIINVFLENYPSRNSVCDTIEILNSLLTFIQTLDNNGIQNDNPTIAEIRHLYVQEFSYQLTYTDIHSLLIPVENTLEISLEVLDYYIKESSKSALENMLICTDIGTNSDESRSSNILRLYMNLYAPIVKNKDIIEPAVLLLGLIKGININILKENQSILISTLFLIIYKYIQLPPNRENKEEYTMGLIENTTQFLYVLISCNKHNFIKSFETLYKDHKKLIFSSIKKLGSIFMEIQSTQMHCDTETVANLKRVFVFLLKLISCDSKTKKNIKILENSKSGNIKITTSEKMTSDIEVHDRTDHITLKFNKSLIEHSNDLMDAIILEVKNTKQTNNKNKIKPQLSQFYKRIYKEMLKENTNNSNLEKIKALHELYRKFQTIEEDIQNLNTNNSSQPIPGFNIEEGQEGRYRKVLTYDSYQKGCPFSVLMRNKETFDQSMKTIDKFLLKEFSPMIKSLFEMKNTSSHYMTEVKVIKAGIQLFGTLFLCEEKLVFIPLKRYDKDRVCLTEYKEEYSKLTYKDLAKQEGGQNEALKFVLEHMFTIKIEKIRMIFERRFVLRSNALEIFTHRRETFFMVVIQMEDYQRIKDYLLHRIDSVFCQKTKEEYLKEYYTPKWIEKRMSTFKYLHILNLFGGRTYCDITQYPVYPWVYDFEANSQRNLRKPIGALNLTRALEFKSKYTSLAQSNSYPYHYGSHYSSAPITCYYLIRLEPFYSLSVELQGGKIDVANRLFHSIPVSWLVGLTNMTDVKELIPEMYHLPDMLLNVGRYNLGIKQDGLKVNHVVLPNNITSLGMGPDEFIIWHRNYLESYEVSSDIHNWIDLIFGFKQKGVQAKMSLNAFNSLTYSRPQEEENTHLNDQQIYHFGQTPEQLFTKQHSARKIKRSKQTKENYFPTKLGVIKYKETFPLQQTPILNPLGKNRFVMIILKKIEEDDKHIKVLDTQTKKTLVVNNKYHFSKVSFIFKSTWLVFSSDDIPGILFGQVVASESCNGVKLSYVFMKIPNGPDIKNVQNIITTKRHDILLFVNETVLVYYKGICSSCFGSSLLTATPTIYNFNFSIKPCCPIGFCRKLKIFCIGKGKDTFIVYSLIRKRICHVVEIDKERLNIQNIKATISHISISQLGYVIIIIRKATKNEDLVAVYSVNGRYITHTSLEANGRIEVYNEGRNVLISHKYCLIKYSLPSLKAEKSYIGGGNNSIEIRGFSIDEQNSQVFIMDNSGNVSKICYTP
eukprot:GAHX01002642.1.p1 GENE.GAHX01002642.1~~GAHX01002642.1.p1  ORF type:complete len:1938 (-),score=271.25 GAHX01002642.1:57-5870(-)